MLLYCRDNTSESRGRGCVDGDHLKSLKSETILHPSGDGEQADPGPASASDELKTRYDNSLKLLFDLFCANLNFQLNVNVSTYS